MAISRMQEPQQIQRGLGSLQDPRQNYGLGKLVKKALRGVKKIVKSPLGKAALIGGLGMWGMGAGPFAGGKLGGGFLKGLMSKGTGGGIWNAIKGGAGKAWGWAKANPGKASFLGLGATALAAPFLMGKEEPEEEEESWTQIPSSIADIRAQARSHYTDPGASTLSFMPNIDYVNPTFYSANGGRAGLLNGGGAGEEQLQQMLMAEFIKYKNQGGQLTFEQFVQAIMQQQEGGMEQPQEVAMAADGGRIAYSEGSWEAEWDILYNNYKVKQIELGKEFVSKEEFIDMHRDNNAQGGRIGALNGGLLDDEDEYNYNPHKVTGALYRRGKQEGGLMDLGDQEKDYRETGGFVDLGGKERADDVPARLSKNEFVFTADAVRAAGGGDIDAGSEVMQNVMDNLEQGGEISEESQGLEGAQAMYDQQQMLQSRIA